MIENSIIDSESAFAAYWDKLLTIEPRLVGYPKLYQAQLRNAFMEGFKAGVDLTDPRD